MLQCGLLRSLKIYVDGLGVARLGEKNRKKEEEKEREQEEEIWCSNGCSDWCRGGSDGTSPPMTNFDLGYRVLLLLIFLMIDEYVLLWNYDELMYGMILIYIQSSR